MYMCEHMGPPHACAVMPWGGGVTYSALGVGWCSYDASTMCCMKRKMSLLLGRSSYLNFELLCSEAVRHERRFQMQGGKNWILPK
jgi:hypothetical protein